MTKHKKRKDNEANVRPQTITVVSPPPRYEGLKIVLEAIGKVALCISLVLSVWQFKLSLLKEDEASRALQLANQAQKMAEEGRQIIAEGQRTQRALEAQQSVLSQKAEMSRLTILAETGNRSALLELMGDRIGPRRIEAPTADYPTNVMNADRILYRFSKDEIEDANARLPWSISLSRPNCIPEDFTNASYIVRAWAVQEVGHMRRYDQIGRLVEIGLSDPDLRVVQAVSITLRRMLGPIAEAFEFNTRSFVSRPAYVKEMFEVNWVGSNREQYDRIPPRVWAQSPGGGWELTDPVSTPVERRDDRWIIVDPKVVAAYSNAGITVWYPMNERK